MVSESNKTFALAAAAILTLAVKRVGKSRKEVIPPRLHKGLSSLHGDSRQVAIVTTAAIPWMTGTAVNPCLRAAYMAHCTRHQVTLLIPWLNQDDQALVFHGKHSFEQPEQQTECIKEWLRKRTGFEAQFKIRYYPGRYDTRLLGIFPVGDLTVYIPAEEADVAILDEPEHLTWFHHGTRWTDKFNHVVGVMHTNYRELGRRIAGPLVVPFLHAMVATLCAIHCHKVVKLSNTVQTLPRQVTCNVHGVAQGFLDVGRACAATAAEGGNPFSRGAYCLGKIVWGKGWEELIALLSQHTEARCQVLSEPLDIYGTGEAASEIQSQAGRLGLGLNFLGPKDHIDPDMHAYQVFINPSTSDVVATTSMEALAMGKWVICAHHPCNEFISAFGNCLIYHNPQHFSEHLQYALLHKPAPLTQHETRELSWEAATERMLDAAELQAGDWPKAASKVAEATLFSAYNAALGLEPLRVVSCAGANTVRNPQRVTDVSLRQPRRKCREAADTARQAALCTALSFTVSGSTWQLS
ncbi:hypothetical protein ABBQ38_002589 [Trebouxia sp. C0009 RCD-2024]